MKTGYLITARLKSQRLKKKILLDIDGETVLDKVIKRCKSVSGIDTVILCTSTNLQDAQLENVAKVHDVEFFRGDEDDVLKRLLDAAKIHNLDNFLSITADNPLHSVKAAKEILEFDKANNFDFIFSSGFPIGLSPNFVKTEALDVAVFMKKESNTEIWGPFVDQPEFFKIGKLFFKTMDLLEEVRITCDYEEDFLFIKKIYNILQEKETPDIDDIEQLYISSPEIFEINQGIVQRSLDPEIIKDINQIFFAYKERGLLYAKRQEVYLQPALVKKDVPRSNEGKTQ